MPAFVQDTGYDQFLGDYHRRLRRIVCRVAVSQVIQRFADVEKGFHGNFGQGFKIVRRQSFFESKSSLN